MTLVSKRLDLLTELIASHQHLTQLLAASLPLSAPPPLQNALATAATANAAVLRAAGAEAIAAAAPVAEPPHAPLAPAQTMTRVFWDGKQNKPLNHEARLKAWEEGVDFQSAEGVIVRSTPLNLWRDSAVRWQGATGADSTFLSEVKRIAEGIRKDIAALKEKEPALGDVDVYKRVLDTYNARGGLRQTLAYLRREYPSRVKKDAGDGDD